MKHIKGEWRLTVSISNKSYSIASDECIILQVIKDPIVLDETWERQLKDAKLIATAPEMLECLIDSIITDTDERGCSRACLYCNLKKSCYTFKRIEVIEKATGLTIDEVLNATLYK